MIIVLLGPYIYHFVSSSEIMPCDDQSLCAVNVSGVLTGNTCVHTGPGNYSCDCASEFWMLNPDNSTCIGKNIQNKFKTQISMKHNHRYIL